MKIYIYFKNGNVFDYEIENAIKAREHAEKIFLTGFRVAINNRHEWYGSHYIDKICWDGPDETYLSLKYKE